jgi:hypothetical protein
LTLESGQYSVVSHPSWIGRSPLDLILSPLTAESRSRITVNGFLATVY